MSRRIGFLSVLGLLFGGCLVWLIQAPETAAQAPVVNPQRESRAAAPPKVEKRFPPPPAHRKEGIFHLYAANEAEQKIQAALIDPQGVEIEFIDTPLKDAMEFIADAHNITILIDEQALTEEGVSIDEPINRTLSNIRLESALKILLKPLGLMHIIEDEVLKVTTIAAADARRITRVYHTGYLQEVGIQPDALGKAMEAVVEPARRSNPRALQSTSAEKQTVIYRDQDGRIRMGDPPNRSPILLNTAQVSGTARERKPEVVQNSIESLGDMVVVSAPKSVHEKIRDLLIQLDRRWELESR
jgi:type II secretory pathway component GspD/PulD (secretin)